MAAIAATPLGEILRALLSRLDGPLIEYFESILRDTPVSSEAEVCFLATLNLFNTFKKYANFKAYLNIYIIIKISNFKFINQ